MSSTPSPDDECGVCGATRENHGDKNHEFSIEGVLTPKKAPAAPRQMAPSPRAAALGADPVARLVIRLVERLAQKGLLDGEDMLKIFGGEDASDRGQTP
jgi:hypothetical protein